MKLLTTTAIGIEGQWYRLEKKEEEEEEPQRATAGPLFCPIFMATSVRKKVFFFSSFFFSSSHISSLSSFSFFLPLTLEKCEVLHLWSLSVGL